MAGNKLGIDDVNAAENDAKTIKQQADQLHTLVQTLNKTITSLHSIWHGPDSNQFHDTTWPNSKTALQNAHNDLVQLHSTLTKNITAQKSTSSTL